MCFWITFTAEVLSFTALSIIDSYNEVLVTYIIHSFTWAFSELGVGGECLNGREFRIGATLTKNILSSPHPHTIHRTLQMVENYLRIAAFNIHIWNSPSSMKRIWNIGILQCINFAFTLVGGKVLLPCGSDLSTVHSCSQV